MDNLSIPKSDTPHILPQLTACMLACIGPLIFGFTMGFSSPAIPEIMSNKSEGGLNMTTEESSWFSSLITIGALVGGALAAISVDKLGRKLSIMLSCIPYTTGWFLIVFAKNAVVLYLGRILTGIGTGIVSVAVPTYVAEISSKQLRGATGAGFQLSITIGVLVMYIVGLWVSYIWLSIIASVCTTILIICMLFLPESPTWLLRYGFKGEALRSLTRLRGNPVCVEKECNDIEDNIVLQGDSVAILDIFRTPGLYKPLILILGTMIFQQLSGINAVLFNSESIFKEAGFGNSAGIASVILAVVQVIMTFVSCLIMDKAGRKTLLILSGSLMSASCVTFSLYYIFELKHILDPSAWYMKAISLGSLGIYISMFSIGWGPVPWLYMSEILPSNVRGICSGLATATNWSISFLVTKFFTTLQIAIKPYGVFWLFAGTNFLGVLFVVFFIIETKGKSLEEIERLVQSNTQPQEYQPLCDNEESLTEPEIVQ